MIPKARYKIRISGSLPIVYVILCVKEKKKAT